MRFLFLHPRVPLVISLPRYVYIYIYIYIHIRLIVRAGDWSAPVSVAKQEEVESDIYAIMASEGTRVTRAG